MDISGYLLVKIFFLILLFLFISGKSIWIVITYFIDNKNNDINT